MVIVKLNGGLGNQLFQYAAGKSLSLHHRVPLLLETSSFYRDELPELEVARNFELYNFKGIKENTVLYNEIENKPEYRFLKVTKAQKLLPKYKRGTYNAPFFHYDKNFFKSRKNVFLFGLWQSEKYFKKYETQIRQTLILKDELLENARTKGEELKKINSVSVHIRRGDYLRKPIIMEWHGILGKEYFLKALNQFRNIDDGIKIFYFTDDIAWVHKELIPEFPGEIISSKTKNHYEDLFLMSCCRHNIIANSSFSWWGAWLNESPEKIVIAPKNWFDKGPKDTQDIIPKDWIKV